MTPIVPEHDRLADYVRHWAAAAPDAPAWAFGDAVATYAELSAQVDAVARALLAAGVRRGDRVAMLTTPRPEFWQTFLACASVGAVWVGLNPRYRLGEMEHVVTDSRPVLLLALARAEDREFGDDARAVAERGEVGSVVLFGDGEPGWAAFLAAGAAVPDDALEAARAAVTPDDAALIVYTSGSTGTPKGAVLGHRAICTCFRIQARHQSASVLRVIANLPVNHIGGVGDLCCTPLVGGGTIVFQERFSPDAVFDAVERHRVTALMQVPTTLKLLSEHPRFASADLSSLEAVHWGGGPLPAHVVRRYRRVASRLGVTYGLTEITGSVTYSDPDASDEVLSTTVGRPIPEIDVRLAGPDGKDVGVGAEGEVQVRHPGRMLGYFRNPDATLAAGTPDGYLRTGDVAVRRADGNLQLVGRQKEMFKSGGYNVYPREIELAVEAHPAVRMAAVVAVPDPVYDEVGVAFVECDAAAALTPEDLHVWCRARLANYKIPKVFSLVSELPLLPVGKIDKKALAARAAAEHPAGRAAG
ncbi:class I adenylate-forming enzyme family protein [Actinomadura atramentaria]|uniref:class I adenylate-forming enzyme family protein n=1 Tax=Actinomadura atramentaria TaxID=1990 RepID=UPI000380890E|nr:class I adenylate-forming enzyme family protein [Actinomadura atramentaria]